MKTFLTRDGKVVELPSKNIPTWAAMCEARDNYVLSTTITFLKRYGLEPTIFNVANYQRWGIVHLYPHFVDVVLEHGAKDERGLIVSDPQRYNDLPYNYLVEYREKRVDVIRSNKPLSEDDIFQMVFSRKAWTITRKKTKGETK